MVMVHDVLISGSSTMTMHHEPSWRMTRHTMMTQAGHDMRRRRPVSRETVSESSSMNGGARNSESKLQKGQGVAMFGPSTVLYQLRL